MKQRIGLLGGSFDPVHNAHLALAAAAHVQAGLASVQLIPVGHAWQKERPLSAAKHRLEMLRLAAADLGGWASVNPLETERAGPSYTLDTLNALDAAQGPQDWFWLMGSDQLANFCTWQHWPEIAARVTLAVAVRPEAVWHVPKPLADARPRLLRIDMPELDISATAIRDKARRSQSLAGLVPARVAQYIALNNLYKDD